MPQSPVRDHPNLSPEAHWHYGRNLCSLLTSQEWCNLLSKLWKRSNWFARSSWTLDCHNLSITWAALSLSDIMLHQFTKNFHPAQEIQYCGGWGYGRHSKAAIELIKKKCPDKDWFCDVLRLPELICPSVTFCHWATSCNILSHDLATLSFTLQCFIVASFSSLDGLDPVWSIDMICFEMYCILDV